MTQPCSQRPWAIAGGRCSRPADGTQASWLPDARKCELRREFEATLAALEAALDPADRELDLAIERPPPQWN